MTYHGSRLVAHDVEDTVYACKRCGTELIRTAMRQPSEAEKRKTAEAA
jgi:DNA-directed RNA polymerase subunit RPC12/RpoP